MESVGIYLAHSKTQQERQDFMKRHRAVLIALGCFAAGMLAGAWFLHPEPISIRAESTAEQPLARRVVPPEDGKLRIICFGAHPDDCELQAGGPLARRRTAEVERAARILGITTEVLDIHDGELLPTLENRRTLTRLIREWKADIVMSHRPNDYHPDHRYTGILVQDSAYMVTVPFFCPDTPILRNNPVFLFYPDRFQKPNPFQPDIAVSIDSVI